MQAISTHDLMHDVVGVAQALSLYILVDLRRRIERLENRYMRDDKHDGHDRRRRARAATGNDDD